MKDSANRIKSVGCSDYLLDMAKRVRRCNMPYSPVAPSVNLLAVSVIDEHLTTLVVKGNSDLMMMGSYVEVIRVCKGVCNDECVEKWDVASCPRLKSIEIDDECFENVKEVKLIGLHQLERVVIGRNCFTKQKNNAGNDPDRYFYLKDCERLRELKVGVYSFSDYSVCEIENVPSLEVIEIGELNEESECFWCASLGMKSDCERMK